MADLNTMVKDKLDLFKCWRPSKNSASEIKWAQSAEGWVRNRLALHGK